MAATPPGARSAADTGSTQSASRGSPPASEVDDRASTRRPVTTVPGLRLSATARTETFSDGVFAIAITLLVLDVRAPSAEEITAAGSLLHALARLWPIYLSYLATFLTLGVIWLNHHAVFAKIARLDRYLQWWNLLLLLTVAFMPFPNQLVAEVLREGFFTEPARTATAAYALVFTASTLPWVVFWTHLARHPGLLEAGYTASYARIERRRAIVGVVVYAVAVAVAIAAPLLAVLLFLAAAGFYGLTAQGSRLIGDDTPAPTNDEHDKR